MTTVFAKARKAGLFGGHNPVVDTEPRKVPKRIAPTLLADQVSLVLGEVPDQWRAFFATAVFTGMRKGELCGLRKSDVDLVERTITVRRSYARDTTKAGTPMSSQSRLRFSSISRQRSRRRLRT